MPQHDKHRAVYSLLFWLGDGAHVCLTSVYEAGGGGGRQWSPLP